LDFSSWAILFFVHEMDTDDKIMNSKNKLGTGGIVSLEKCVIFQYVLLDNVYTLENYHQKTH